MLSRGATSVTGVDANPEAHEHDKLRYTRQNLRFERGLVETFGEPGSFDAVVFLQTIEHVHDPPAVLAHFRCPTSVEFVASLPRTATGKLQKFVIREKYWQGVARRVN